VVPVPDWTQFDGSHWGALTLGETTLADFTRRFSSRETDTPGLLVANTPSRTNTRAYVLFAGAHPEARLEWVTLFMESGKPLAPEALLQQYGSQYAERFPESRTLDWRLWLIPERGVAGVVDRNRTQNLGNESPRLAGFLFARPMAMASVAERLPKQETPVTRPEEQDDEAALIARIGRVSVTTSREGDINFDRDRLESTVESQVQLGLSDRGAVLYDRSAEGRVSVSVRVRRRPDRDGRRRVAIDVNSSITAAGPYAEVSGYGSASREIEGDTTSGRIRSRAADAAVEATHNAENSVRQSLQKQRSNAHQAMVRGQMLELTKLLLRTGRTYP
jgi:hypothetical protein